MGTNYYMTVGQCKSCGRSESELHIGKSSAGWNFSLNTHPDNGIESLADWQAAWSTNTIRDEYCRTITPEGMMQTITERAQYSPDRPLIRHEIDGRHCIAHGAGTYDIMRGEFS